MMPPPFSSLVREYGSYRVSIRCKPWAWILLADGRRNASGSWLKCDIGGRSSAQGFCRELRGIEFSLNVLPYHLDVMHVATLKSSTVIREVPRSLRSRPPS